MPKKITSRKKICLALQGGGAHGAFTWGVLDAFLEDKRVRVDGVSATSAGALNGIALAYGLATGNTENARTSLHHIWHTISRKGALYSPVKRMPWENWAPHWRMDENFFFIAFDIATRTLSPYQFNPMGLNPLREVLREVVDFDDISMKKAFDLYVSTTCVETGKVRVFANDEVTDDVILASSALPFLYHAVEIDGKHYWDGGYVGNPPLFPLVAKKPDSDIFLVQINPTYRKDTPKTSYDINNRMHEIAFNTSMDAELKHYAYLQKIRDEGGFKKDYESRIPKCRFHSISGDEKLADLAVASKFSTDWDFLRKLRDEGRRTAYAWLERNYDSIGKDQTYQLEKEFLKDTG